MHIVFAIQLIVLLAIVAFLLVLLIPPLSGLRHRARRLPARLDDASLRVELERLQELLGAVEKEVVALRDSQRYLQRLVDDRRRAADLGRREPRGEVPMRIGGA